MCKIPLKMLSYCYAGMPVSRGSVKGVARVVKTLEDADQIQVLYTFEIIRLIFRSSGNMDCMLFWFDNGVLLMH